MSSEQAKPPSADAESIVRLRGEGPRVVRLSRKAVGAVSAIGLALVGGALVFALQPPGEEEADELINTDGIALADELASAPGDYSQVPRLGPPLPGDLGQPILDAQDRGAVAALPPVGGPGSPEPGQGPGPEDLARQRIEQERDTARLSTLFIAASARPQAALAKNEAAIDLPENPGADPDGAGKIAQLSVAQDGITSSASAAVLQAGSIIPAALITGIRSDQPGLVTAQVTQNVFDSPTGRILLIPQGSRLIGEYEAETGFGQRRVLLVWTRLIFPGGRSIALDRQPAADPSGYAGLEDRVDHHWGGVLKAALVSTLLGAGAEFGSSNDSELARALRDGAQDSIGRTGEQIVSRQLGIRSTLTIRPGFPVRVLVTSDILLGSAS